MISVCVLTWQRLEDSEDAIRSVYATVSVPYEVVVLDQSPENVIGKHLEGIFPDITIYHSQENRGVAAGRNFLFSKAKGDFLFSIDDDSTVEPGVIDQIHQIMSDDHDIGVLACNVIHKGNIRYSPNDPAHYETMYFNGQSAISRTALSAVGGYAEHFFRESEEKHLALKIIDAGFSIRFVPALVVNHKQSPIDRDFSRRLFLAARNELYMVLELAPWPILAPLFAYKALTFIVTGIRYREVSSVGAGIFAAIRGSFKILRIRKPVKVKTWIKVARIKLKGGRALLR